VRIHSSTACRASSPSGVEISARRGRAALGAEEFAAAYAKGGEMDAETAGRASGGAAPG
jgi:hypothetical protein